MNIHIFKCVRNRIIKKAWYKIQWICQDCNKVFPRALLIRGWYEQARILGRSLSSCVQNTRWCNGPFVWMDQGHSYFIATEYILEEGILKNDRNKWEGKKMITLKFLNWLYLNQRLRIFTMNFLERFVSITVTVRIIWRRENID